MPSDEEIIREDSVYKGGLLLSKSKELESHYIQTGEWEIQEKYLLVQALNKQTYEENDHKVSRRPKIQMAPAYMATKLEFEKFYTPQLIKFGPIHYRRDRGLLGKEQRYTWAAMYFKRTNQTFEGLGHIISSHLEELNDQLLDRIYWRDLTWILVIDGCSILQVLEKSDNSVDPEQELKISIDKLVQVHHDLLILENQIPFKALKLLCNDEARFKKCLHNFLQVHGIYQDMHNGPIELKVNVDQQLLAEDDPVHLLDYLRRALLMRDQNQIYKEVKGIFKRRNLHHTKYRIGTVRELKAAGIHVKKDPRSSTFYPSFSNGKLHLPELTVDGSTAHILLNMIAYEMCPDFCNDLEITSYVVFMSSLIDQPEDVKELRTAGVLINELANDKQVADLFNKMDSVLVPETARFANIRNQIQKHFEFKRQKIKILGWMGEAYQTYFRSPWTVIALLAGSLGLVLTIIQTWFTVHPKGSGN